MGPINMRLFWRRLPISWKTLQPGRTPMGCIRALLSVSGLGNTPDRSLPILYQAHVNKSFLDQFPQWRM